MKLQQRLPARARQPKFCPSKNLRPKRRPSFRNRVPVRVGKGKTVKKRFVQKFDLAKGTHRIAVLRSLGARKLATGHYRLWIVAHDREGNPSGAAALHFRVLRR